MSETRAHAPEATAAQRWLGKLHVTGVVWYRLHGWGARTFPDWLVAVAVAVFTSFFFVVLIRIRSAIAANLEVALGPCGFLERQRRIWRTLWRFAWCLTERNERLSTTKPFDIRVEGMEAWREAASREGGFVMVTAHVGNYEVGSMLPSTEEARRVVLVREPEGNPAAQEYVESLLEGLPGSEHYSWHFEGDGPLQAVPLLAALRRGDIVAVQGDRPRSGSRTIRVPLLGRPFEFPAGPATLARAAEAPLLPVFMLREGRRRYRLVIREPFTVERTADRDADLEGATRRIADAVERAVREEPHQWFCFRDVFAAGS